MRGCGWRFGGAKWSRRRSNVGNFPGLQLELHVTGVGEMGMDVKTEERAFKTRWWRSIPLRDGGGIEERRLGGWPSFAGAGRESVPPF